MFELLSTRYTDLGINTISHVEIFKASHIIKNPEKKIYHLRLDHNNESSAWQTMEYFLKHVVEHIDNQFIMMITGEDLTFPNQVDPRWKEDYQYDLIKCVYHSIIHHPLLLHCFIENRDQEHPKTSSLPLGINPREMPDMNVDYLLRYMNHSPKIKDRITKIICINRLRQGDREIIEHYKNSSWKDFTITTGHYEKQGWFQLLQTYPFIICPHGGGIDPCPKVWEALCIGCIPIIKSSAMDDIYKQFPIVIVHEWTHDTINKNKIEEWLHEFADFFDNEELRKKWQYKLYTNHWKNLIYSYF